MLKKLKLLIKRNKKIKWEARPMSNQCVQIGHFPIGRRKIHPNFFLPTGDLWSFNYQNNEYVVSPVPDVSVQELDPAIHKCLILGSDGLWNVMTAESAAAIVADLEYHFEYKVIHDPVCIRSKC